MRRSGIVEYGRGTLRLGVRRRGAILWSSAQEVEPERVAEVLGQCWAELGTPTLSGVEVWLSPALTESRTLHDLPSVSRADLVRLVANHRERYFVSDYGDFSLDATWLDRTQGAARAVSAPTSALELVESAVEELGWRVTAFRVLDRHGDVVPGLDLHTGSTRQRSIRRARRLDVSAALIALLGLFMPGIVYLLDLRSDGIEVEARLAELSEPVTALDQIEGRLDDFRPILDVMERQGPAHAWLGEWMAKLAEALPLSAHLVELRADRNGSRLLVIRAPDALAVLDSLSTLPAASIRISEGPVTERVAERELERFSIVIEDHP